MSKATGIVSGVWLCTKKGQTEGKWGPGKQVVPETLMADICEIINSEHDWVHTLQCNLCVAMNACRLCMSGMFFLYPS